MYGLLAPEDKQQAIYQGLLGLGAGMVQGSAPSTQPKGLLGGFGQGAMGFQQGLNNYAGGVQRNKMAEVQMAGLEDEKRRRAAQNEMIAQLPEAERLAAMAAPDAFVKAKFSTPKDTRTPEQRNAEFLHPNDPDAQRAWLASTKAPAPKATFETVKNPYGRGGVGQRNSQTGQLVNYQGPDQLTELRRIDEYIENLPMDSPLRPQYVSMRDRVAGGKSLVNVDLGGGQKTSPELMSRYEKANAGQQTAAASLDRLNAIEKVVRNVDSGWGGEAKVNAQKLLMRVGLDVDENQIANAELLQKFSIEAVMDIVQQTKGAVSNKEMEMFMNAAPSLSNTPEGNKRIIEYTKKMVERSKELESYMASKVRSNPNMSVFDYDAIRMQKEEDLRGRPLFDEKELLVLTGGPPLAGGNVPENGGEKVDLDEMLKKFGGDLDPFID